MPRIYIIRHGKAERESDTGLDRDRALRPRGERQAAWAGAEIARLEAARAGKGAAARCRMLASRYLRAHETAKIIQRALGCPLALAKQLEVGNDAREALPLIAQHDPGARDAALLLVGHNPQLEALVEALAPDNPAAAAPLRTGECAVFDAAPAARGAAFTLVDRLRLDEIDGD